MDHFQPLTQHLISFTRRLSLQSEVRRMGKSPSPELQIKIQNKRQRLQISIDHFLKDSPIAKLMEEGSHESNAGPAIAEWDDDSSSEISVDDIAVNEEDDDASPAEHQILPLPSSLQITSESPQYLRTLAKRQLKLEMGHANDTLHKLRLAIGHKSFIYRNRVRPATNYAKRTRAHAQVRTLDQTVSHCADVYKACREAMVNLSAEKKTLDIYQVLEKKDLITDTAVMDPYSRGSRNAKMSWIWKISAERQHNLPDWLTESKHSLIEGGSAQPRHATLLTDHFPEQSIVSIFTVLGREC